MSTESNHNKTSKEAKSSAITICDGYATYTYHLTPSHGQWSIQDLYEAARKVCGSPESPGVPANHSKRLIQERDRYRELAHEMEFRLKQAERRNIEHESDYLAVWKTIKEPHETLLESCKRVVRERDELRVLLDQKTTPAD